MQDIEGGREHDRLGHTCAWGLSSWEHSREWEEKHGVSHSRRPKLFMFLVSSVELCVVLEF